MRRHLIGILSACAALAVPSSAVGATVEVLQTTGETNKAELVFTATAGEGNQLTVAVAGESSDTYDIRLLDTAANVAPGTGCSGGGAPGVPVRCALHKPVPQQYSTCVKTFCIPFIGSAWDVRMRFSLGDAGSLLDAGSIPNPPPTVPPNSLTAASPIPITVTPGAGNDTVITAGGADVVRASAGNDRVRTGEGADEFLGGPAPDGADDVDPGGGVDTVDYSERSSTVLYSADGAANDGAPGEGDNLVDAEAFFSGSGDDVLKGGGARGGTFPVDHLFGAAGDDVVIGGSGNDLLGGGTGSDRTLGGGGNDRIFDVPGSRSGVDGGDDKASGGAGDDEIALGLDDDVGRGGAGNDVLTLGPGADIGSGGPGKDILYGERGDDSLAGGGGGDQLVGNQGVDRLFGGDGGDGILSGAVVESIWSGGRFAHSPGPLDNRPDHVDCGAGRDRAGVDRTDFQSGCESTVRLSMLELLGVVQARHRAAAQLWYEVRSPGVILISAPGLKNKRIHEDARYYDYPGQLPLHPTGQAKQELRRGGHVKLTLKLVFKPANGGKITRSLTVRLLKPTTSR
jgi:Ca2+-binding RTX toxin-like protein